MKHIAFVLVGLVTVSMYGQTSPSVAAATAACGPGDPAFAVSTKPGTAASAVDAAKPQLYLLEVQDRVAFCPFGCGQTVKLGMDGDWAGATKGNSFMAMPVGVGEHHLCVEWDAHGWGTHKHLELTSFSAQPGKSYYFRVHITPATTETIEMFRFEPLNDDEAKLLLASRMQTEAVIKK